MALALFNHSDLQQTIHVQPVGDKCTRTKQLTMSLGRVYGCAQRNHDRPSREASAPPEVIEHARGVRSGPRSDCTEIISEIILRNGSASARSTDAPLPLPASTPRKSVVSRRCP
jgi:hypothetical protein